MLFYFAPLEGITNYIFRNTYSNFYKDVDKYFTPFLNANSAGCLAKKSQREVNKENNLISNIVPQLLTNNSNTFNIVSATLKNMGYNEINLNLGCPSGTVTSKFKGSGQLRDTERLRLFFDDIFKNNIQDISVKTRIGYSDPLEIKTLLTIFNDYPIKELIVHPRLREDYYKGPINLEVFKFIVNESKHEVCYNGDLFTVDNINEFVTNFPTINKIMLGRGLIANPGLVEEYKTGKPNNIEKFREFHDSLYKQYSEILYGERSLLFKMKDYWRVWKINFPENEKQVKKLQKSQTLKAYHKAVDLILK
ncbi:MAG: tRNA-dihydrouridine synthase [Pleomorphochaeta sp.]